MIRILTDLKTKNTYKKKNIALFSYWLITIGYICYLIISASLNQYKDYSSFVYIFNWLGIFTFMYILLSWRKLTGNTFTPYIIFMTFFFLFQYGQQVMWAVGIHRPNEIGKQALYPGLAIPTSADIFYAQTLLILSMLMFHFGAIIAFKKLRKKNHLSSSHILQNSKILKSIFYVCLSISMISVPLQLYRSFNDLKISQLYGYKALYYSEFASKDASFFSIFLFMFFPCLIGLLIGSKFDKKISLYVYIVFGIYVILNLLSGDRGSWIYKIIILIWLSHISYKSLDLKRIFKYFLLGVLSLYFIYAIIAVRDKGVNLENIMESFSVQNSPIITVFFEMGSSLKPMIVLQKYGWDIWPYENTYILAITGMVTNKIFAILGLPFELLSSFFSQDYLGLSWGAGFSIIAESLLNFGPYYAPLFMVVLGWIITSIIEIDSKVKYISYPLGFLFAASSLEKLIPITRNIVHIPLKEWFYGVIVLLLLIIIVSKIRLLGSTKLSYIDKE